MIIQSLELKDFRNYQDIRFDFSPRLNIIVGQNAQGKTNLIEAVFFLSRGYSHRAAVKNELCAFGRSGFVITGDVKNGEHNDRIGVQCADNKKSLICNGKKDIRQEALNKICKVILFEPEDLRIVKAGPEKRRRFLNEEISGIFPGYFYAFKLYQKILRQRNALLKEIKYDRSLGMMIESWDSQLAQYGAKIIAYRIDYLKKLRSAAASLHRLMSNDREDLTLYYQSNVLKDLSEIKKVDDIAAVFHKALKSNYEQDVEKGTTSLGPQLDDILIKVNGQDARKFASQGQQRTAAIALKLSQITICEEITGELPIVLLDDVLSELDACRQESILKLLGKTQAFITCTDDSFVQKHADLLGEEAIKTFRIADGKLIVRNSEFGIRNSEFREEKV